MAIQNEHTNTGNHQRWMEFPLRIYILITLLNQAIHFEIGNLP